jgi:hypothetical protein
MGGLSIWHLSILMVLWIAWITPLYKILGRIGFSRGWAFLALFPPAGMVILWVIAFTRWRIADTIDEPVIGFRS